MCIDSMKQTSKSEHVIQCRRIKKPTDKIISISMVCGGGRMVSVNC